MNKNYTTLRAQAVTGETVEFDLTAAPTVIDAERFILMKKQGSPIMLTNTVCAGSDMTGVFEGSVIEDNEGTQYTVSYRRGFAAMDANRNVCKLHKLAPFTIVQYPTTLSSFCRARLSYKYADIMFQFKDIVGAVGSEVLVQNKHTSVVLSSVQQSAGVTHNGSRVFFGDTIDGKLVTMNFGRVCLYDGSRYIDITDKEEIPECSL